MTPLPWFLAIKFLREGRMQTVMITVGVSVGVAVMVFLSALISGLEKRLVSQTLGTQAHVVVRAQEQQTRTILTHGDGVSYAANLQQAPSRIRSIDNWQHVIPEIQSEEGVRAVSPIVSGPGFVTRGLATKSVVLFGVDPDRFSLIYRIQEKMISGQFSPTGTACVIGKELAEDLGVHIGDRVRVSATSNATEVFVVVGIFDLGNRDVNRRWLVVSTRAAQTLLDLAGAITSIDVTVQDVFSAEKVAVVLSSRTGLIADSWMKTNAQLMVALQSQRSSSNMIQTFVILAVALGISSVLVVSVVQKGKEIGILRAMGTSRRSVLYVFLLQGLVVGLLGSVVGIAIGSGLVSFFANLIRNPDGTPTFALEVSNALIVQSAAIATITGLLSAVVPARRAAALDPAVAIRNG